MKKEGNLIITICLFPMVILLSILKLTNFLKSSVYNYIILILVILFLISFIFSLFYALDDIIQSSKWERVLFLLLFSIFYLPIYYVKYINDEDKYLGYLIPIMDIILCIGLFFSFQNFLTQYMVELSKNDMILQTTFNYMDKNKLFTIDVDKTFSCNQNLGEYVIACDRSVDDSFIGIYNYQKDSFSEGEIDDIKDFHLEQTIDVIEENNYEYEIIELGNNYLIGYQNMSILLTERIYYVDNKQYIFIIVKECPTYEDNIRDFEKMIETIEFIK